MSFLKCAAISLVSFSMLIPAVAGEKLKPEELVARHLASVGAPEAREAAKSRQVSGTVHMQILAGGGGIVDGDVLVSSQENHLSAVMKFANINYEGEEFTFDGEKVKIGYIRSGARSRLGALLNNQPQIVREGLLGGVLSTAWPLLNVTVRNPRLSSDGLKKVDGRQLYQLSYQPRKGSGDTTIKLYFEPDTFRHVLTVYSLTLGTRIGANDIDNARQQEKRIRLEESFADFKENSGLTLPTRWTLKLTTEGGENGPTAQAGSMMQWDMTLETFKQNPQLDAMGK